MPLSRPSAVPHPIHERALEDLRYIRSAVESAGSFTVSGSGGIAMGVVGLVAAVIAAPETGTPFRWLTIWLATAVVATLTGIVAMIRKSRRTGSSLVSPPARRFALAFDLRSAPAQHSPAPLRPEGSTAFFPLSGFFSTGSPSPREAHCTKSFDGRQPRTEYRLTSSGRKALKRYLNHLEALIEAMRR